MCQDYSLSSDVWSAGVIFGELLKMIEDNCPKLEDRTPLLPGKFCFPLSPRRRRIADDGLPVKNDNDQLDLIFNLIGTPSQEDIEHITDKKYTEYLARF